MAEGKVLKLIGPLRELFEGGARELGRQLGIANDLIMRYPFPGPGIAIRIISEVTPKYVETARKADHIFINMVGEAGLYGKIEQAFAALDPSRAVAMMGDKRAYESIVLLRAFETTDFMTTNPYPFEHEFLTKVSTRIINEVH